MTEPNLILDMISMNGVDGVTTKELVVASGKQPTQRAKESMLAKLNDLIGVGKLECVEGWRKDIMGRPCKVPVYRPVKP